MRPRRNRPLVHHRHRACRATSSPPPARSSRCSSTTSTICRRPCARTWRAAASEVARAQTDRRRGSRTIRALAAVARRDSHRRSRCGSTSSRCAARSSSGSSRSSRRCRPRRAIGSTKSRACIVEKLLSTPTEQLKALGDAERLEAYLEAVTRLFGLDESRDRPAAAAIERVSDATPRRRAGTAPDRVASRRVTNSRHLRIGTRGSQLALWQARTVAARIAAAGGPACTSSSPSRRPATACRRRRCRKLAASVSS